MAPSFDLFSPSRSHAVASKMGARDLLVEKRRRREAASATSNGAVTPRPALAAAAADTNRDPVQPVVDGSNDGHIPDDDFAYLRKSDITLILNTADTPVDLGKLKFQTTTCLIYSEAIVISQSVRLPGKSLGLFCSSLSLTTSAKQPFVTIDVSGEDGVRPETVTQGPGKDGNQGSAGGQVWLFVESLTDAILQSLKINAVGGDGSPGGSTSDADKSGGKGGPGGDGGSVMFLYGSTAWGIASRLHSLSSASWTKQAADGRDIVLPALKALGAQAMPSELTQPYADTLAAYNGYAAALDGLVPKLQALKASPYGLSAATLQSLGSLLTGLLGLQASVKAPNVASAPVTDLTATTTLVDKWLREDANVKEADVAASLQSLKVLSVQDDSDLASQSSLIKGYLVALIQALQQTVQFQLCDADRGQGGPGGSSSNPALHGAYGADGAAGSVLARNLAFDGRASDLAVTQAYVFPDHCQMLLNKADALYFSGTADKWKSAAIYYERLATRLSFVPSLSQPLDPAKPTTFSQLYYAYSYLQNVVQISTSCLAQLQSVYAQAKARLNQLGAGQDMFGHAPDWCPRLSFTFYQARVASLLTYLEKVESANTNFINAITKQTSATDSIQAGLTQLQTSLDKANDRISLLTNANGPLAMSAAQITLFTPQLKEKRSEIADEVAKVQNDIQNSLNIDPQMILSALSMIAMAPTTLNVLTQVASVGYGAWTQVKDDQGIPVDKKNIISQLATCSSTLSSLTEAFKTRQDDSIEVDDPGAMKIIAAADDLKSLVEKFKSAIPAADKAALEQMLDDYVGVIQQRNDAVLQYNSALQLLHQALEDKNYYSAQLDQLGQDALAIDANLPSIAFWLRKQMNDVQLDIMQRLNYEARAIRYWGLLPPISFAGPGPLRGSVALDGHQQQLSGKFEEACNKYGQSIWTWWPSSAGQSGQYYQLTSAQLSQLKKAVKNVYGVIIRLDSSMSNSGGGPFTGRANIRLNQVRVWVLGAKVNADARGRQPLMVEINQSGIESLLDTDHKAYSFTHDSVDIQFTYDCKDATSLDKCDSSIVQGTESIQNDYTGGQPGVESMAPLGPFSQWRIQIKASENQGVDLSAVTAAYIEFWGRNMAFST